MGLCTKASFGNNQHSMATAFILSSFGHYFELFSLLDFVTIRYIWVSRGEDHLSILYRDAWFYTAARISAYWSLERILLGIYGRSCMSCEDVEKQISQHIRTMDIRRYA